MNWKCNHGFTSSKSILFVEGIVISDKEYELLLMDEQDRFSATDEKITSRKRIKELISESN